MGKKLNNTLKKCYTSYVALLLKLQTASQNKTFYKIEKNYKDVLIRVFQVNSSVVMRLQLDCSTL